MAAVELENLCKKFSFSKAWGFNRSCTWALLRD